MAHSHSRRWARTSFRHRGRERKRPHTGCHPVLESLEDRSLLSAASSLWISTAGNATVPAAQGGISWVMGDAVNFGDPNLALGPGATNGTFSKIGFNLDSFAADGAANLNGMDYVSRTLTVGGAHAVTLQPGDLLLSTAQSEVLGGVPVAAFDIALFRPTTPGNYGSGTFSVLLQSPLGATATRDFALVETPTVVGGVTLNPGDFLLTAIGAPYRSNVTRYQVADVGPGTTSGTTSTLIDGLSPGVAFNKQIYGLELVQQTTTIGGTTLTPGQFLLSLDAAEQVATNGLSVTQFDVFVLTVTATGTGTSSGSASLLVRGSDVGLSSGEERYDALALVSANSTVNSAPVLSGANGLNAVNEDPAANPGTPVSALIAGHVTDADAGAKSGVAVTAVDNTNGSWQYTTDAGVSWTAFGTPTPATARLLASAAGTAVRFVPNADWNGTVPVGLSFRAWDQTGGGAPGGTADVTVNGGSTAFSAAVATSGVTVNPVNDAPVRTAGAVNNLTVLENSGLTTLGLGALAYGPGGGADEAGQTLTYTVTAAPPGTLGDVVLADGVTVVAANTGYTLAQLRGMKFRTAGNASGGPATFAWAVKDSGGTANGGVDTLAESLGVTVTHVNQPPTVAAAASATPSPVTGTTTNLSVLGGDDGGESNLTYTWAVTARPAGAGNPTFRVNTGNAAKATTATFFKAGNYTFQVTITDAGGLSTTSGVAVTVNQTLTTVDVSPPAVTLNQNQTQAFTATASDQFGVALAVQPSFAWAKAAGVGSIDSTGLYTAPSSSGSATVTATAGAVTGSASVTVVMISQDVTVDTTRDVVDGNTSSLANLIASPGADGHISLREAILAADNSAGLNRILFNIPDTDLNHYYYRNDGVAGSLSTPVKTTLADAAVTDFDPDYPYAAHSWFRIDLNPALAELSLTRPVFIDGYSQPGSSLNTLSVGDDASVRIELTCTAVNGNYLLSNNRGLDVAVGGSTIRGLAVNRFGWSGIMVDPGADGTTVEGNFLGTDVTGTVALGNGDDGIQVRSSGDVIGGGTPSARNVVSGNLNRGLNFFTFAGTSDGNLVRNNYFGTDATGTQALGNAASGVVGYNLSNSSVLDNVISANAGDGLWFRTATANGNTVQGNRIGTDATGTLPLGNAGDGVLISNGAGLELIGGTSPGQGNVIADNGGIGVNVSSGTGTAVLGNAIFGNTGLGIDLKGDGVTPNNGAKTAGQPDLLMDFPVFTSAVLSGSTLVVSGYVGSAPNQAVFAGSRVEIFATDGDPRNHGEGKTYLGYLTADGNGNFSGSIPAAGLAAGVSVTGTATDAGNNTSEFGLNDVVSRSSSVTVVTASPNPSVYGQSVTFTATVSGSSGTPTGTVTFLDGSTVLATATLSGGVATFSTSSLAAGSHAVTVQYGGDPQNLPGTSTAVTETVTPATLTVTADALSKSYGAAVPALTYTYAGLVNGDSAGVFTGGLATPATSGSGVGGYAVSRGTLSAGPDYAITFSPGTLTVTPATLTVTADDPSKVYGAPLPGLTYTYAGLVNGDTAGVFTGGLTTTATAASAANFYGIDQGTLSAGPDYAIAFGSGTLTVTPATVSVTADDLAVVYGAPLPALTYTYSGLVNGDTAGVFSGGLTTQAVAGAHAGSYAIDLDTLSADPNYTIDYVPGTLTVTPAALTVTADDLSKTYGAPVPPLTYTYSGLVNGDTAGVFSGGLSTPATAASHAGGYGIGRGTLSAGPDYTLTFNPGTLTVTPAALAVTADDLSKTYGAPVPPLTYTYSGLVNGDSAGVFSGGLSTPATAASHAGGYGIGRGTLSAGPDYAVTFSPGTLTVTPAALTVTADDLSKTYGAPVPPLTYTYSGLVNGDTAGVFTGGLTTPATAASHAGGYGIGRGTLSAGPDYTLTFRPGTLTVTPAALSVTADDLSKPYGAPVPPLTYTYSGLVNGDTAGVFTGGLTTPATAASHAGGYGIGRGTLSAGPDYTLTFRPGTLTVTPAALTVTADGASRAYGRPNPGFSATYAGFVNGDGSGSLGGSLTFGTPATAASPVGTYPVTPGGLTSPDYDITFADGTLTVSQAALTITADDASKVYGQPNPGFTATYTGLVNGDSPAVVSGLTFNTTATTASAVGRYNVVPGGASAVNYSISYADGSLVIRPASLLVTADSLSKTYGAGVPSLTYAYAGLMNGDTPAVFSGALSTTATAGSGVGGYAVSRGTLSAGPDYAITFSPGTLTVTPAALTVTADDLSKVYGAPLPGLTYTYAGLVNGDTAGVFTGGLTTTATAASGVGLYSIDQGTLSAGPDYAIAFGSGTLTVTPATVSVTADDLAVVYGAPLPALTYTYSGLVNGDTAGVFSGGLTTHAVAGAHAGSYAIDLDTLSADPNYTIDYVPGTLTVTPAALTVTADDLSKTYGAPVPPLTYTYSGLVNGDTAGVFSGGLSTPATAASHAGGYGIGRGTLTAGPDYTLTFSPGTLTVTPAALSVTADDLSKTYGVPVPALTYTYSGLVNGDTAGVFTGGLTTPATAASHAGGYGIGRGTLTAGPDYALTFSPGTLTVTPAALTVTADGASRAYGRPNPGFSATYAGFVNGDGSGSLGGGLAFATPATAASPVGTYPVTPGGLISSDYDITFARGTLTVVPLSLAATGSAVVSVEGVAFAGTVAVFASPDATPRPELYTATIRWGDGRVSDGRVGFDAGRGVYTVEGVNTYQQAGVYAVQTAVRFRGETVATAVGIATVADAPVTVTGRDFSPKPGDPYSGTVAAVADANPSGRASDLSVTLDWGDGSTSPGTVAPDGRGGYLVAASHTYDAAGSYAVAITVADRAGSRASADVLVRVVGPTPAGGGTPAVVSPGVSIVRLPTVVPDAALLVGGPVVVPPAVAFGPAFVTGSSAVPTSQGRGGAPTALSPGVLGAGPGVAPPVTFGSGSGPAADGPPPPAAAGGGNGARATGNGAAPGAFQAAVGLVAEAAARQLDALIGALSRAFGPASVRQAIPGSVGDEIRTAAEDLAPPSNFLWGQLDDLGKQLMSGGTEQQIAQVLGTGAVAYVGYVLLNSRAGYLLLSVLTAKPLWAQFDPLAVLLDWENDPKRKSEDEDGEDEEEETLQSLIEGGRGLERDEEGDADDAPELWAYELDRQPPVRRARSRALTRPRGGRTERAKGPV